MQISSPTLFWAAVVLAVALPVAAVVPWRRVVGQPGHRQGAHQRVLPALLARIARWLTVVVAQVMALLAVFLHVNQAYGLYSSWSDLLGTQQQDVVAAPLEAAHPLPASHITRMPVSPRNLHPGGKLVTLVVPGADATFSKVSVWLPPQYFERRYDHVRFPVLLMMDAEHGTGAAFASRLQGPQLTSRAIASGKASPFIVVYTGSRLQEHVDTECVDLPNGMKGRSWYSHQLVESVTQHYRTRPSGQGWYAAGYSTGGLCAAELLVHDSKVFTAGVSMGGYYTPVFDDISLAAGHPEVYTQNSLVTMAKAHQLHQLRLLSIMSQQDPQSWGDGGLTKQNGQVMGDGQPFYQAARQVPGVAFMLMADGGHHEAVYLPQWPAALAWLGTQGL